MKKLIWIIIVLGLVLGTGFVSENRSCQRPLLWVKAYCEAMEETILAATVQIVIHGSLEIDNGYEVQTISGTFSHGTVIDGRYLLTHNHFGLPLSQVRLYNRYANGGFSGISIYGMDGTAVIDHGSMDDFEVVKEEGETVLLDFGMVGGQGFFTQAGLGSMSLGPKDNLQLEPGVEVAQIDRDVDGNTYVAWTKVTAVYQINGFPMVKLDNYLEAGASGGGVFLNGKHIGNNWAQVGKVGTSTSTVQPGSLAALNIPVLQLPNN